MCECSPKLAPNADVAGLAAGVFLSIHGWQAHQLVMAADLRDSPLCQRHRLSINQLQNHILRMLKHHPPILPADTCQEAVIRHIQLRKAISAVKVSVRAPGSQDEDNIMIGSVHAVEVPEVEARIRGEQNLGGYLEAEAAVWGILWRLTGVKLSVAAEEDPLQFTAERWTVTTAVVLYRGHHSTAKNISVREKTDISKIPYSHVIMSLHYYSKFCGRTFLYFWKTSLMLTKTAFICLKKIQQNSIIVIIFEI